MTDALSLDLSSDVLALTRALVDAPSAADMDAVIDTIGALDGVERTTSSIVLGTKLDR